MVKFSEYNLRLQIDAFELFARVFREEALSDLIEVLRMLDVQEYFSRLFPLVELDSCVGDLELALRQERIDMRMLRVEYARLFIGPNRLVAPPWGSVYMDSKKTVMGESTLRVREFYAACGVAVLGKNVVPDDHIAFELSFVSHLLSKAFNEKGASRRNYLNAASSFAEEFIEPWVGSFAYNIVSSDVGVFYKGFATMLPCLVGMGSVCFAVDEAC